MVSSFLQSATKNEGVQISAKCTWWRPLDRCSRETVGFCKTVFRYLLSLHQSKFKEKVYRCLILSKHKMQWMNFAPWYPTACDVQLTMLQSRWKNAPDGGESQLPKYTVGSCKTKQTLSRRQPLSKKPGLVLWGSQHRQNTKLVLWGSQHTHRSCEGACEYKCEIMIHYQSTAKYLTACWSRKGSRHLSPSRPHKKRTQLYTDMLGLYCSHVRQQHKTSLDMFIWQETSKKVRLTVLACQVGCTIWCLTPTYHSSKQAWISY